MYNLYLYVYIYIYLFTSPSTAPIKSNQSNNYFICTVLIRLQAWKCLMHPPSPAFAHSHRLNWGLHCEAEEHHPGMLKSLSHPCPHPGEQKIITMGGKKGVRSCEIDWYILVQGIAWYCCAELCSLVQLKSFRFDALNTRVDARLCLVNSVHLHLMAVWCNIFSPFWQRIASHPLISCHIQVISQIPGHLCIKPLHEFDSFLHIKAAFWHT